MSSYSTGDVATIAEFATRMRRMFQRGRERADIARHAIDTHFEPSFHIEWHPMTLSSAVARSISPALAG